MALKKYFYQEIWNIGIIQQKSPLTIHDLANICQDEQIYWLQERYHFQADPYLFEFNEQLYVFYEALNHTWVKGHLRCRVLDKQMNELDDFALDDINALGCHLSFPQLYLIDNEIYLIPESHENQAIYLFKAIDFPKCWQKINTITNQPCIDSVLYQDVENQRFFVITNDQKNLKRQIFTSQQLTDNWQEIPFNQDLFMIDNQHQRLGGGVLQFDRQLYLPMQEHSKDYGKSLFIKKIILPTVNQQNQLQSGWQEITQFQLISQSLRYPDGLHTLNISQNYVIIDAKRWAFQPLNFFIRKYRQLLQKNYQRNLKKRLNNIKV